MAGEPFPRTIQHPIDPTYVPASFRGFPDSLAPPRQEDDWEVMEVRAHTLRKLHVVGRILNAVARSQKNYQPVFLDLYAGPGIVRQGRSLAWGSPLLALQCADPYSRLIMVDRDRLRCDALSDRVGRLARRGEVVTVFNDEAERCLPAALDLCPSSSLVLALVDPFRIDFSFRAMELMAQSHSKLDVVMLLADGMDMMRNLHWPFSDTNSTVQRLDQTFGDRTWADAWQPNKNNLFNVCRLTERYIDQLRARAGFTHIDDAYPIRNSKNVRLYSMIYASRHPLGRKLWQGATKEAQLSLPL